MEIETREVWSDLTSDSKKKINGGFVFILCMQTSGVNYIWNLDVCLCVPFYKIRCFKLRY